LDKHLFRTLPGQEGRPFISEDFDPKTPSNKGAISIFFPLLK